MSQWKSLLVFVSALLLPQNDAAAFVPLTTNDGRTQLRWFESRLEFHLATAEPEEIDLAAVPALVTTLFAQWSSAPCGRIPEVSFGGMIEANQATSPAVGPPDNLIVFVTSKDAWLASGQPSTMLATIVPTFDQRSGQLIDVDILVNDAFHDFTVSSAPAPGEFDLGVVLLHEIGHFYGLDHSEDEDAVMHDEHTPGHDTLSADDVAGVCAIYPEHTVDEVSPLGPCCGAGDAAHGMGVGLLFLAGLAWRRRPAAQREM